MRSREYRGTVISGWFSPEQGEWLRARVEGLSDAAIALVGIYQGLNLSYVVDVCRRNNVRIYAVDVWEKIGNTLNGQAFKSSALTGFRADLEQARLSFAGWIAEHGFAEQVEILQHSSVEAARTLPDDSLDLVFLDADHGYDSVLQDLGTWYGKLKPGRLLAGDDWDSGQWPGVVQAVQEFACARDLSVSVEHKLWSFRKV